jgi:hypothetical protein
LRLTTHRSAWSNLVFRCLRLTQASDRPRLSILGENITFPANRGRLTTQYDYQTRSIVFERQCKKCVLNAHLRPLPLVARRVNRNQKQSATAPASVSSNQRPNFRCPVCFRLPFVMFQNHAEVICRTLTRSKNTQLVSIKLQAV